MDSMLVGEWKAPTSAGQSLPVRYLRTHLLYANHMRGMRTENRGSGVMETGGAQKREWLDSLRQSKSYHSKREEEKEMDVNSMAHRSLIV